MGGFSVLSSFLLFLILDFFSPIIDSWIYILTF
jgi:hypothetical protein